MYFGIAFALLLSLTAARGQFSLPDPDTAHSVSGQFIVFRAETHAPPRNLNPNDNTNIVQLKPALLAVAAERFKLSLWHQLGIQPRAPWSGKIYLRIYPADSLDDAVTIAAHPFLNRRDYVVDMPDFLPKTRYARALSSAILLEIANRSTLADVHSAEVPAWLVDGLAQQVLATQGEKVLLSAPRKKNEELEVTRLNEAERGFDPFTVTRNILQSSTPLTFDQLSWPVEGQVNGNDGGIYYASAQLFQFELLALPNGPEKMRAMLAALPSCFNWQTAFFHAFGDDFARPLDVEKWWALRVVNFCNRASGPRWTGDVSLARFQELLSVPVEFRNNSNAMPSHAEISLQSAIQNLPPDERDNVLRMKVRDFELVELRLAPPFSTLADAYRMALVNFLGEAKPRPPSAISKHGSPMSSQSGIAETLKKLNTLDTLRRDAETKLIAAVPKRPTGP